MIRQVTSLLNPRNLKLPAQQAALLVSVIILLIGTASSVFFGNMFARQVLDDFRNDLLQKNASLQSKLTESAGRYTQLLRAGVSLFALKESVSRDDWRRFYEGMQVTKYLPDTLGVGYITYLRPDEVQAFTETMKTEGLNDFALRPDYVRSEYTAVTYLEPTSESNAKAFGFDMMSEPARNAAMSMARDTGEVRATAPVVLIQDIGTEKEAGGVTGIVMYQPVYANGKSLNSVEARRQALRGFVYTVMRPEDVLRGYFATLPALASNTMITVHDITDDTNAQVAMFDNLTGESQNLQSVAQRVEIADREWQISVEGNPGVVNSVLVPVAIVSVGTMLSFAVAAAMLRTLLKRIERVERTYAAEVEKTKDELLALASHQLRTPASGVKQYIGILTSGIVGELTPAQQQIAEKAYATNERQIEIINQLLYVSKIEAGKIIIRPEKSDMTHIVQRIVDQHVAGARQKNIKLLFKVKRKHYIYGDEQYYPMIIDNLISNAIKYSYARTSVTVTMAKRDDMFAVSVTDKGVGVAQEDRAQLFKKFNRIQNPLSRSEGGSGLGLFLAYQLAKAHGGMIEVKSAPGKGSTFSLLMPTKQLVKEALVNIVD